jgi:hypothetical protein
MPFVRYWRESEVATADAAFAYLSDFAHAAAEWNPGMVEARRLSGAFE